MYVHLFVITNVCPSVRYHKCISVCSVSQMYACVLYHKCLCVRYHKCMIVCGMTNVCVFGMTNVCLSVRYHKCLSVCSLSQKYVCSVSNIISLLMYACVKKRSIVPHLSRLKHTPHSQYLLYWLLSKSPYIVSICPVEAGPPMT